MQSIRLKKILEIAAVIIFFSAFVFSLIQPISDPDIFWHLKTGEWIWQNKALPDKDPFTFTVEPYQYEASAKTSLVLKQYWLAQLILYAFYQIGGFFGIILFRCLIYLSIGLLLYHWMGNIKNSSNSLSSSNSSKSSFKLSRISRLIFLMPVVYFSTIWFGERPNYLSVLFTVVVVYLLENLKQSSRATEQQSNNLEQKSNRAEGLLRYWATVLLRYCSLPVVMLLWANMHGGFIVGVVIIGLYTIAEGLKRVKRSKRVNRVNETFETSGTFLTFFIICLVSIIITLINPNTYKAISMILKIGGKIEESVLYQISSEVISPIVYARSGDYRGIIMIGAVVFPLLLKIKQLRYHQFLSCAFFISMALYGERYIPFLVFIGAPIIAELWAKSLDRIFKKTERFYVPVLVIFAFVIFLLMSNSKTTVFKGSALASFYPESAVKFMKTVRPEGELFNDYNNGGFLIWSLWPDYRVFIDSRNLLHKSAVITYERALFLGSLKDIGGLPEWKRILTDYNIKSVLIPAVDTRNSGFFMRLVRRLVEDSEWELVFIDKEALLFIKNTGKNRNIIKEYSQPKALAYIMAIEQAEFYRSRQPDDWKGYITLGEINLYLGKPRTALLYLESAIRLNPSLKSTSLSELTDKLRDGKDYAGLLDKIFREPN